MLLDESKLKSIHIITTSLTHDPQRKGAAIRPMNRFRVQTAPACLNSSDLQKTLNIVIDRERSMEGIWSNLFITRSLPPEKSDTSVLASLGVTGKEFVEAEVEDDAKCRWLGPDPASEESHFNAGACRESIQGEMFAEGEETWDVGWEVDSPMGIAKRTEEGGDRTSGITSWWARRYS